jgi:hypothetical protein
MSSAMEVEGTNAGEVKLSGWNCSETCDDLVRVALEGFNFCASRRRSPDFVAFCGRSGRSIGKELHFLSTLVLIYHSAAVIRVEIEKAKRSINLAILTRLLGV